jgi:hypothetical protein
MPYRRSERRVPCFEAIGYGVFGAVTCDGMGVEECGS